jgi:hypothetical protein
MSGIDILSPGEQTKVMRLILTVKKSAQLK